MLQSRHCQGPTPQPGDNGGGQGGGGRGGGGGGHSISGGSHEDDRANDNLGSSYCSDGDGDTHHDGRNPRNQPKSAPRVAEGNPYDLVGPLAFGYQIRSAPMPHRFGAPNIKKYDGETDPKIWLVNYQLTMTATSASEMFFMIQFLPIYLTDSARN